MNKLLALGIAAGVAGVAAVADNSYFSGSEFTVAGFANYIDEQEDQWGGGASIDYFITRHLGLGVTTHWENFDGPFWDNLAGEAILRLPLNRVPVAPYAIGTVGYNWETEDWFEAVGGGLEFRFTPKIGMFGDAQWQFNNDGDDGLFIRAGLRFVF